MWRTSDDSFSSWSCTVCERFSWNSCGVAPLMPAAAPEDEDTR